MTALGRRARKLASRLLRRGSGAAILGYHRIADPADVAGGDPYSLCVSPALFREQMAVLGELGRPVSLDRLCSALRAGEPVRGMIAVTFDDAYADVLSDGLPALEEYGVPATVYFIGDGPGEHFWWDILNDLLSKADPSLPFCVRSNGTEIAWAGAGTLAQLQDMLHRSIRVLESPERFDLLARMATAWGVEAAGELPRSLDSDGARRLIASPMIEPGVHTLSHPALAEVSAERAEVEIAGARETVSRFLEHDVVTFSYPHGSLNETARRLVEAAEYRSACAAHQDSVRRGADVFALPRIWIPNRPIGAFRRLVRAYTGSARQGRGTGLRGTP